MQGRDHPVTTDALALSALTRLTEAAAQRGRWMVPLRAGTAVAATWVVLSQGPLEMARYMFLAPVLAIAGWSLDARLAREKLGLEAAADAVRRGLPLRGGSLSLEPQDGIEGLWLASWFEHGRALYYGSMLTLGASIAVDAQRFLPSETIAELLWYATVAIGALLILALVGWHWWTSRFGESTVAEPQPLPPKAFATSVSVVDVSRGPFPAKSAPPAEPSVVVTSLPLVVEAAPAPVVASASPGPFPVGAGTRREEALAGDRPSDPPEESAPSAPRQSVPTQAFGSPVLPE